MWKSTRLWQTLTDVASQQEWVDTLKSTQDVEVLVKSGNSRSAFTKKGCCCSHRRFPSQASFHSSVKVSHQRWPTSRASLKPRDKALLVRQPSKNGLFSLNLIKSWFRMMPWFNIPIILRPKTSPGLSKYLDHFSAPMMCWRICASDVAYAVLPQSRNLTTRPWLRR